MKQRAIAIGSTKQLKAGSIKTTFLELLETLSRLTKDDALVIAAVRNIFQSHNVRLERSLAPVRLAIAHTPAQSRRRIDPVPSAAKQRNWKSRLV
jgi:hypothetical protein